MVPIPAKAFYKLLRDEEGIDMNVIYVKNLFSSGRGFFIYERREENRDG